MKKLICIMALMLALVLALTSCGVTPTIEISEDGYWVINGEKTDVLAKGEKGDKGDVGPQGPQGESGDSNETSFPKNSLSISCDGHLVIDGEKTDVVFQNGAHTFGEWTTIVSPTAGSDGMRIRLCSGCGEIEAEIIHAFNDDGVCTNCVNVKAALIAIHGTDSPYDKNFIEAFETACRNKGLKEENYTIITDIPEDFECYNKAIYLADEGYDVIFADSFGHEAHMLKAAEEFPNVQFCHATGTNAHTAGVENYQNAFAAIYEGRYLTGVAAGLKLLEMYGDDITAEEAKVGCVAAWPFAEVISGYTAFFLGVRSVVPNATMEVLYTNSWYDEIGEKVAAEILIASGCKLISQYADSMGASIACENAGIPNVAYNATTSKNTFVVASKINWVPYFEYMLDCVINGKDIDTDYTGTLATGSVEITVLGNAAAAGTQEILDAVKAELIAGTRKVFDCSTFTVNNAKADTSEFSNAYAITIDPDGHLTAYLADVINDDLYVGETDVIKTENGITYFAESEFRSAPYFNIVIDGITVWNPW